MSAPSVALDTQCCGVPSSPTESFLTIRTGLVWKAWHSALESANLLDDFHDVPHGLQFGFRLGPTLPLLTTFIPPNHKSALDNPSAIASHIRTELINKRYTGPFNPDRLQQLIGFFQTSPLGVIPKSGNRFRIIQDMSFPRDATPVPSINSQIHSSDFRCEWSTFSQCFLLVARAPRGAQAAVFDVDSAYRDLPVSPLDQPYACVQFQGSIFIDHCLAFGCTSSSGIFGRPADAIVALYKSKAVDDILKWVDDFVFFRYPVSPNPPFKYHYNESLIWSVAKELGWPWSIPKHQPFASSFTYLGFLWDLDARTVQLPSAKKLKYIARLQPLLVSKSSNLRDAQKLLGTLNHCAVLLPDGPSRLPTLFKFTSGFRHSASPFVIHRLSTSLLSDLEWWIAQFSLSFCGRSISEPPPLSPIAIFVDASTSWGIGILIDGQWDAYQFTSEALTGSRNIGWAEMVAVELAVGILASLMPRHSHVLINSDNQGVLAAIRNQRSRGVPANESLQRQCRTLLTHDFWISCQYVASEQNLADSISRGLFPTASLRLHHSFPLPATLSPFMNRA